MKITRRPRLAESKTEGDAIADRVNRAAIRTRENRACVRALRHVAPRRRPRPFNSSSNSFVRTFANVFVFDGSAPARALLRLETSQPLIRDRLDPLRSRCLPGALFTDPSRLPFVAVRFSAVRRIGASRCRIAGQFEHDGRREAKKGGQGGGDDEEGGGEIQTRGRRRRERNSRTSFLDDLGVLRGRTLTPLSLSVCE